MIRLTQNQIQQKIEFINQYLHAENAATASQVDANANVTSKNIATMEAEINKDINIQINRELVRRKIAQLFGEELAGEYIRQIEAHEIYVHDETSLKPYCVSISMYPFLLDGLISSEGRVVPLSTWRASVGSLSIWSLPLALSLQGLWLQWNFCSILTTLPPRTMERIIWKHTPR